jgi:hypothetical protein
MVRKLIASLLIAAVCTQTIAQSENFSPREIKVLADSVVDFAVDNLGNVYLLKPGQQIKKLDDHYDSVALFNDVRRYGKLHAIDASNPLKVLLFYKDFNTIVVLDRFLNIRNSIDLRQSGIFQVSTVATSFDNNIWLYDELEGKIKKIDDDGALLLESPDFRVVYEVPPHLNSIVDHNRYLYAYDSSRGLLVMDYFGASKNLLAFKGWSQLQPMANGLVAVYGSGLIYYEPGKIDTQEQALPAIILQSKKIRIVGAKLYALQQDMRIHIYQLQP